MYFLSFVLKYFVLVFILVVVTIQLLFIRNVSSLNMTNAYLHHKCYVAQGKYKLGSEYEKELNKIIRSIPINSNFTMGFEMTAIGNDPFVSVLHQCRGDTYGPKCRSCYATAVSELQKRCPKNKGGIIWFDQCFLEINGIDSLHKVDYDNNFCMSNAKNVSGDKYSFDKKWIRLLDDLFTKITKSKKGYAMGEESLGTKKLYGMVQCTGDLLSFKACDACYTYSFVHFQNCMRGKQGARVLGRTCNFRFELYPFMDIKTSHK